MMNTTQTQTSDLLEVTVRHWYECFGDHSSNITYIVQRKDLMSFLAMTLEQVYADVTVAEDWPGLKPRPTARELHDVLLHTDSWGSAKDGMCDDSYTITVSPMQVWAPTTTASTNNRRITQVANNEPFVEVSAAAWEEFKATLTPFELSLRHVAVLEWHAMCMNCDLDQHDEDVDAAKAAFKEALAAHSTAFNRSVDDYQTDVDNHEVKCENARQRLAAAAVRSNPQPLRLVTA